MGKFIKKPLAKKLYEKGFILLICVSDTPLYSEVVDWLREKHQLHISLIRDGGYWFSKVYDFSEEEDDSPLNNVKFADARDGYYDSLHDAIIACLKLI